MSRSITTQQPWTPDPNAAPAVSLESFIEQAWRLVEPAERFVSGWHLSLLCQHLEAVSRGELHDLLINVPPGTTKSLTVGVFWPAWEWTWKPYTRWLTTSYDARLATRDAVTTRRLMQSEWYQSLVQTAWRFASDQNVKGYYQNDRQGWRLAIPIIGGATGSHAHRVVVDDPHNVNEAESEASRTEVLTAWRETYPSRVLKGGARVVVGQRVHEEDLSADWKLREPDVHHLELRMEHDVSDPDSVCTIIDAPHDPRTEPGELLAPGRFDRETVEQRKAELGPYAYAAQYDQRPTPRSGAVLDPALVMPLPEELRPQVVKWHRVMWWDLNYSEKTTADFTAGLTLLVEPVQPPAMPRMVIAGLYHKQLAEERHADEIADEIARVRPAMVCVATKAYETQFATRNLCKAVQAVLLSRWGLAIVIDDVAEDGDKVIRARIIEDQAKAGRLYVDTRAPKQPVEGEPTPFWPTISREMTRFPKSGHDDTIDAASGAIRTALEKLRKILSLRAMAGGIGVRHQFGGRR